MKAIIAQILRSRWLAVVLHATTWLLVYLSSAGLGGNPPLYRQADGSNPLPQIPAAVGKLDRLFTASHWPALTPATNSANAFYTLHFTPAPAPAPPPPTTKKIELTYQGYYFAEAGAKRVMLKYGEGFLVAPEGEKITANLFAAKAAVMSLLLTNSDGRTNLLPLNKKQEVEIPIK